MAGSLGARRHGAASGGWNGPVRSLDRLPSSTSRRGRFARRLGPWLPEAGLAASLLLAAVVGGPARGLALLLLLLSLLAWAGWRGGYDSRRPGDWSTRDRT